MEYSHVGVPAERVNATAAVVEPGPHPLAHLTAKFFAAKCLVPIELPRRRLSIEIRLNGRKRTS